MCLAIYPLSSDESVEIPFALERIYQRRSGSADIWLDLLVKNTSQAASISQLRVLLPYKFVDLSDSKLRQWRRTEAAVPAWRRRQLRAVRDETASLAAPDDDSNWIYKVVGHTKTNRAESGGGSFAINREGGDRVFEPLKGFIKQRWSLEQPSAGTFDDRTWLLLALNELAAFDLICNGQSLEYLHKGESMWFRLVLSVPPDGYNHKPLLLKVFGRTYEYRQVFTSPARICREARRKLQDFRPEDCGDLRGPLELAKARVEQHLPSWADVVQVRDWRTFLYREYGLAIRKIEQLARVPHRPSAGLISTLPPAADPPGCRRFPMPKWLHVASRRKSRTAEVIEFFFGLEWPGGEHPDDYVTESYTEAGNAIYNYLAWAGLIGLTLSIINLTTNLFRR